MYKTAFFCYTNTLCLPRFWRTREHWQNMKGNKGTLANFWEQGTKFRKITVRKHSERVWEHGNIGQFWKGTRTPPWETLIVGSTKNHREHFLQIDQHNWHGIKKLDNFLHHRISSTHVHLRHRGNRHPLGLL